MGFRWKRVTGFCFGARWEHTTGCIFLSGGSICLRLCSLRGEKFPFSNYFENETWKLIYASRLLVQATFVFWCFLAIPVLVSIGQESGW